MPSTNLFRNLGLFLQDDFLDPETCGRLCAEMRAAGSEPGGVTRGKEVVVDETYRKAQDALVSETTTQFIHERLMSIRQRLEDHFEVTLDRCQRPQFLVYRPGGFYTPHADAGPGSPGKISLRRVSVVLFLNASSSEPAPGCFGGGALAFHGLMNGPVWDRLGFGLEPSPGQLVAFRSVTYHEVRPVTFGERFTVVTWFLTAPPANETGTPAHV